MKKIIVVITLLLAGILVWVLTRQESSSSSNNSFNSNNNSTDVGKTSPNNNNPTIGGNVWFGELRHSDNQNKGNLMLIQSDSSKTYIQTARNFDTLINKQVAVTIKGIPANFESIDIQLNE